jgi:hypothetical protein
MLGRPTGAKLAANMTMKAKILTNHGMLASQHPGVPHGPDAIFVRGGCLQISASFVAFI